MRAISESGLEVFGVLACITQLKSHAADCQSGDLLRLDLAVGLHLGKAFEIGGAGNVAQQHLIDAHNTFEGDVVSAQATVAL